MVYRTFLAGGPSVFSFNLHFEQGLDKIGQGSIGGARSPPSLSEQGWVHPKRDRFFHPCPFTKPD
jgi:hypothetical protein